MRRDCFPRAGRVRGSLVVVTCLLAAWAAEARCAPPPPAARTCVTALRSAGVIETPESWGLRGPSALALDHRGDILISDTGNHRVVGMTRVGDEILDFGGYGWDEGQFDGPTDLAVYQGFFTYVLDEGNRRVERFDPDGDYVDTVVYEGGAGSPVAIAVGRSGELYILDDDSQTILVRSQFNEDLAPVGQFGTGRGGLVRPVAVAIGPRGEIGVADPGRGAIVVFDEFGTQLYELSIPDTLSPADLVFDGAGCVLAVEPDRRRVVAFPPGGGPLTASLTLDEWSVPVSLTINDTGSLYVLDSATGRVLVVETTHAECGARR